MNAITVVVLIFSVLGAFDKLIGDKFGLGKEFEKAFALFTPMVLSMLGMLVVAPAIGVWLAPGFQWFYDAFGIDPSVIPASLFANDMGGMTLAQEVCKSEAVGNYNAFVTSSMMGCVISFTIPLAVSIVKREQHKELFFGLLCGIVTIPTGCFVAGLMCGLDVPTLLLNLLPLLILSGVVTAGLVLIPQICIRIFSVLGVFIRAVSLIGLVCAIFTFLTKIEINQHFDTLENAALVCVTACVTLSGMLPFMYVITKLLHKQVDALGAKIGTNGTGAACLLATLVTNVSTFGLADKMNRKGLVVNAGFAVSAAFVFGGHLAITMASNSDYVLPVIVGKLISGVCAVLLAMLIYKEPKLE